MMNLVDAGMMAKLLLAEKYPKTGYRNLSLKTSMQNVLGFSISKELSESDWSANELTDKQKQLQELSLLGKPCTVNERAHAEGELASNAVPRLFDTLPRRVHVKGSGSGRSGEWHCVMVGQIIDDFS
ncbi:hypothetical protein B0H19DRAFT_1057329 [Mycena capillaripes]|nr:hypothetical protein B0H19DRAFT_1057329 [Mycena capillaripes]